MRSSSQGQEKHHTTQQTWHTPPTNVSHQDQCMYWEWEEAGKKRSKRRERRDKKEIKHGKRKNIYSLLKVHVREKTIEVHCGHGPQRIKWYEKSSSLSKLLCFVEII